MRTRFLGTDYFNFAPFPVPETLEFLRLPPPQLLPSILPNLEDFRCFDLAFAFNVSLEIEKFPVDQALSKFFSDVIPQNINVELVDFTDAPVSSRRPRFQNNDEIRTSQEETNSNNHFALFKLEMPEVDLPLENACFSNEEKMQILFDVADAEVCEYLDDTTLPLEHLVKIQESVLSVEDINVEDNLEEQSDPFEGGGSVWGINEASCGTFPILEVDEASLGILRYPFMEDLDIFSTTEPQTLMQKDQPVSGCKELLLSADLDLSERLLNHSLSSECLNTKLSYANSFLEMYLINIIEYADNEVKSEFHQGREDENIILSLTPVIFEQFQFFYVKTSPFFEVFSITSTLAESESCEDIFDGTASFKNYDELIVSTELTLEDDAFKSLPIPIFPDHGKTWSLQAAVTEIIAGLNPQPSCASDGIYLDWHLLEEDIWHSSKYASFGKMLEKIDTYSIDSNLNSIDNGMLFEFVLSDECSTGPITKENIETLNVEKNIVSAAICTDHGCYNEVASTKLSKDRFQESMNREVLLDTKSEKAPQFLQSVSQFNDLDFFLNPLDHTRGKDQNPPEKSSDIDTSFPVAQYRDLVAEFTTSEVQLQDWSIKLHPEGDSHSIPLLKETSQELDDLQSFIPTNKKYKMKSLETEDDFQTCSMPLPRPCGPSVLESEKLCASMPSSPDTIIIVNTQSVDGEMIFSRRSSYKKILAMEKEGTQVVERDLDLPVDVIVSAAICLVWYDSKNIRKKTTSQDEATSFLPSCVENIAANVLTSLSFTFSSCILVFEGEATFLSGIMELSDELYAAAASLGIELQIFCSYSSELTDDIISSCIGHAAKLTGTLYPKMLESETLAESFLTKIPSVNPLSAHAILSSVAILVEFFEWSHQQRLRVLRRYPISDESISLLSAFCRYGEREDSKSGMTDCSSSVSSAPDSGNFYGKESAKRKRKYIGSPERTGMPIDELFTHERSKHCNDEILYPPRTFMANTSWMSKDLEILDEFGKSSVAFNDGLFGKKQGSDATMMSDPHRLSNSCDFEMPKVPEASQNIKNLTSPANHRFFGQSKLHNFMMRGLDMPSNSNSKSLQKDFIGEVVDIDDCSPAGKDSRIPPSTGFSSLATKTGNKDVIGTFANAKKLSFGASSHPIFPTAAEISSGSGSWISEKDIGQNLREAIYEYPDLNLSNMNMPSNNQKLIFEDFKLTSAQNYPKQSFQDAEQPYRKTPLTDAILSGQSHEGSPWTLEFLNRIREKSKLRQQSLPRDLSGPCFGYSDNISKATKRKSPSILDFYRYQRGSTPLQTVDRKRQKQPVLPSSSSKIQKGLPASLQTWTPVDKRARRRLSFATNGTQGQTKLVWLDKTAQTPNKRC